MSQSIGARLLRAIARRCPAAVGASVVLVAGCTSAQQWVHNGLKVGPKFEPPPAPISASWIDATDPRIADQVPYRADWWSAFNDPTVAALVETASRQNLDLRTAGTRVLQAHASRNVALGNLFPQTQNAIGDYANFHISSNLNPISTPQTNLPQLAGARVGLPDTLNIWATGFNTSWELDFWGRYRRQVEAATADRASSIEAYHTALVTLLADVVTAYVQVRTFQQRLVYARRNVEIQKGSLGLAEARLAAGTATALDVKQARSSLAQTESAIPPLVIGLRQANDQLCVLLGQSARDLVPSLGEAPIPGVRVTAAVGGPADLMNERPDVRRALQAAHAQCARIGVAEADFYPQFGVTGFVGYTSDDLANFLSGKSFTSVLLPNFSWKILNYGRVLNNVRLQDAKFREAVLQYQQTVLTAGREVEDALVAYLQYQLQARSLEQSVKEAEDSVELVQAQYKGGVVDFNRVFTVQGQLVTQQDQLALARGNIALGLVSVHRALGGGWRAFEKEPESGPRLKGKHGPRSARDGAQGEEEWPGKSLHLGTWGLPYGFGKPPAP
jgi:NodT family efflux transporter outer membrane factor (OMF) lipoprotein